MKQILQNIKTGNMELADIPCPMVIKSTILVQTELSLISAGTERMLVEFGMSNIIRKAMSQPDKVRMVLDKVRTDGLLTTLDSVRSKLDQPISLGYSNVGIVSEIGDGVTGFKIGDRVVTNGPHAEMVRVPKNLCATIPDEVDNESAVFTVIASIGLQGIRLAKPTLGEHFIVTGVGLIGLLVVQLLVAQGCMVMAIDIDQRRLDLAKLFGANICNLSRGEDPVSAALTFSRGKGVDGVIITATTRSNDPVNQAAKMCRKRGRIILVGIAGLELNRVDFYEKELSFQVSCSYGPGRYDPAYEDNGNDYPFGLVRWTEQRNFQAVLDMLATGKINVKPLITHRFALEDASKAYQMLTRESQSLGILLQYKCESNLPKEREITLYNRCAFAPSKPLIGFIGAGNYASRVLIPAFKAAGAQLHTIVTTGGINGVINGRKGCFAQASTNADKIFSNGINTVVIATRHNSHARFVRQALAARKHVFVEKPLAINRDELDEIKKMYENTWSPDNNYHLMVGFNRRFSPLTIKMKELLNSVNEPKSLIMVMNAGAVPDYHWTQDPSVGGGRIIGEACHLIDMMRFLVGSKVVSVKARRVEHYSGISTDKAVILLGFDDGSFGTIHYLANGSPRFPKERVEVFTAGRVLQLDNFRKLQGYGWPGFSRTHLWHQDKGQKTCVRKFLEAVEKGSTAPIPVQEIFEVALVTIEVDELLRHQ